MRECCLGSLCVSSWSSYGLKQGIPWNVFGLALFILMFCLPVHGKHKHLLGWEHVVSDHGAAMALNRESLGMFFVSLCL